MCPSKPRSTNQEIIAENDRDSRSANAKTSAWSDSSIVIVVLAFITPRERITGSYRLETPKIEAGAGASSLPARVWGPPGGVAGGGWRGLELGRQRAALGSAPGLDRRAFS